MELNHALHMRPVTTKHNKQLRQRLAVAFADDFLDEADKGTPKGGILNSREGSHKRVAIRGGEKIGDISGRWGLAASR